MTRGIATGLCKMASSLGNSFGIAISTAVYGTVQLMKENIYVAGAMEILTAHLRNHLLLGHPEDDFTGRKAVGFVRSGRLNII